MKRPKRKHVPIAVKRLVLERQHGLCKCGCGRIMGNKDGITHYDHEPALRLRAVNRRGTDYTPPQLDPDYIDARCPDSHRAKTHGTGATTAGTDIGKIKKMRRHEAGACEERIGGSFGNRRLRSQNQKSGDHHSRWGRRRMLSKPLRQLDRRNDG